MHTLTMSVLILKLKYSRWCFLIHTDHLNCLVVLDRNLHLAVLTEIYFIRKKVAEGKRIPISASHLSME